MIDYSWIWLASKTKAKEISELDPKSPPAIHCNCKVAIQEGPFGPHAGKYVCLDHNLAFICWISRAAMTKAKITGIGLVSSRAILDNAKSKLTSNKNELTPEEFRAKAKAMRESNNDTN